MLEPNAQQSAIPASVTRIREAYRPRYAICYAPPRESVWWMFGCAWLGRDAITGTDVAMPPVAFFSVDEVAQITALPRRYGFHATLKAPFRLAPGSTARDLYALTSTIAAALKPSALPPLRLVTIDDFVALSFAADATGAAACHAVAAQCVTAFEALRARPTPSELVRRNLQRRTPRLSRPFSAWGYPDVDEAFRLHLTLTGPLQAAQRARVIEALTPLINTMQAQPLALDALCVYRQASHDAPFVVTRRYTFSGRPEIYRDD